MNFSNIPVREWPDVPFPRVDQEIGLPLSPTGKALIIDRLVVFDYEKNLMGVDEPKEIRLCWTC